MRGGVGLALLLLLLVLLGEMGEGGWREDGRWLGCGCEGRRGVGKGTGEEGTGLRTNGVGPVLTN